MNHVAGEPADNSVKALLRQCIGGDWCRFVVNTDNDVVIERCDSVDGKQAVRENPRSKNNSAGRKSSIVARCLFV